MKYKYIKGIDGLRAIAVFFVMLLHAGVPGFQGGFIGVEIFFVISGFLISSILLKEYDHTGTISIKRFYIRRAFRLLPALVTVLLVILLTSLAVSDKKQFNKDVVDAVLTLFYSQNWTWALGLHTPGKLIHTWSLSIEEQFYIIWPILLIGLLRCCRRSVSLLWAVVGLITFIFLHRLTLSLLGNTVDRIYLMLDTRADSLLVGAALGIVLNYGLLPPGLLKNFFSRMAVAGAVITLFWFLFLAQVQDRFMGYYGFFLVAIASAVILLELTQAPDGYMNQILTHRFLRWAGTISYGLYLWHWPIYRLFSTQLQWQWYLTVTVGTSVVFLVASLSYYFIEKPFLRKKAKFSALT